MIRFIYSFLMLFLFYSAHSQIQPINLILTTDALNTYEFEEDPLQISSTANVVVSGAFESESTVFFRPTLNYNIRIVPKTAAINTSNFPALVVDPIVTTIRTKPSGGGKLPLPRTSIYPVPVQNELTFTTSKNFVNGYKIYKSTGFLQLSQNILPTSTATINVTSLVAGNYILRLELINGQQLAVQFIKN